jgi:hypothetical protein
MKSWLPFLASMLCVSAAFADSLPAPLPSEAGKAVSELIDKQLVVPLMKREGKRSKFSRAALPPVARRVRVQESLLTDVHGNQFVRFSIDQRYLGSEPAEQWQKDRIVGCVYPEQRKIFVEYDGAYLPARIMLGQDVQAQPDACIPIPLGTAPVAEVARS